jgi:ADP-ribose pyrophosphatase YjhB (NUDIX family)
MPQLFHFQEPERKNPVTPGDRIPESTYGLALDHLVIACVDLVFTTGTAVLLGKRHRYPRPDWWVIGGRMAAGESPQQAAIRKASQEAGLHLEPDRLKWIGVYSTCFATRHQPPQSHGVHTLNLAYRVELTTPEQQHVVLSADEYVTWQWVELDQIANFLEGDRVMDKALIQMVQAAQQLT